MILETVLRWMISPWKAVLRARLTKALAEAEAAIKPGEMPVMKVVGDPMVRLTGTPTPEQVADFVRWRSPAYVEPMSDQVADSLAKMLRNSDRPEPFTGRDMNRFMTGSPTAYLVVRDGDFWEADFTRCNLHPYRKITIQKYRFHAETGAVEITDAWGRVHREGDALFETALNHTMAWWNHYIHSGLHNWVHFNLPDTMAEAHTALTRKDTVLARLLAPHVRFTSRINMAGLWVNQATNNGPDLLHRLKPWAGGYTSGPDFQRGIIENTGANYDRLDEHFARPRTLDEGVPYLAYLKAWFPAIERFVQAVDPFIEADEWEQVVSILELAMPEIRRFDRVTVLAEFIWQVGVVHVSDHTTFVEIGYRHGFHRVPETLDAPFTLDDVRRTDRFQTRNLYNVFVRFSGLPELRHGLSDIENYGFTEGPLRAAAETMRTELRAVDQDLAARGLRFLPLEKLHQSVCF